MNRPTAAVYRIREFAALAGVTVRALHHYDRLGLLKPGGRSASGYRLYRDSDLARLEQIVVLKFLGLPLQQIGRLLQRKSPLAETAAASTARAGRQTTPARSGDRGDFTGGTIGSNRRRSGLGFVQTNREGD